MFRTAITRRPGTAFANGLTASRLGPPDLDAAFRQHEDYCLALEDAGLDVVVLDAIERFPDSPFVEDTAVLTDRVAVLARPGAPSRTGEAEVIRPVLEGFFSRVVPIEFPGTVDGGDICEAGDRVLIGLSDRTNEDGARQLASILESAGFMTETIDVRTVPDLLHLKTGLSWLGNGRFAVWPELRSLPQLAGFELVVVEPDERYAANCVLVNDVVLAAAGFPKFERSLRDLGYEVSSVGMSEYRKMDGGLSCLSLRF